MITKSNLQRKNFSPEEFFNSATAAKHNIANYPSVSEEQSILPCLMSTADMMQAIYDLLEVEHSLRKNKQKFYIKINSAYRCRELNKLLGSSDRSQHIQGLAVDFTSSFGTPEEVMKFLYSIGFLVDQCFCEGSWLHISRVLPLQAAPKGPNRMMYGYYLPAKNGQRKFKSL